MGEEESRGQGRDCLGAECADEGRQECEGETEAWRDGEAREVENDSGTRVVAKRQCKSAAAI